MLPFSLSSRSLPPGQFPSSQRWKCMAHWGHAVLARLKAACLLLSHAVCIRTLDKFICSLSDC